MIPVNEKVPIEADFAVRIQGNSMYPHIKDGDTVFVKKNCKLHNGDVGIFSVNGEMYCKQYYLDEHKTSHSFLRTQNSKTPMLLYQLIVTAMLNVLVR